MRPVREKKIMLFFLSWSRAVRHVSLVPLLWAFFVWSEVSQRRHLERVDVSRPAPAHRRGRRPPMGGGERGDAQRSEPGALWV